MASRKFEELKNLTIGNCQCKIKVRVIRFWRGVSTSGEEFKGFNVLLLDNKNNTIHAFVNALSAFDHERKLKVGKICIITTFTVQAYKITDKFRCVRHENQLLFSKDTKITNIDDPSSDIAEDWFDLYDHSDLRALSEQNLYLADVVGIINDRLPFTVLTNKHGKDQCQAKFTISDGMSNVHVTFWDKFGEYFDTAMMENLEKPVIIIIASVRVGWWNEEINLSNVPATKFFLNSKHQCVLHLRKMLTLPGFKQYALAPKTKPLAPLLTVEDLLHLGNESINTEVLIHVKVQYVEEVQSWYYYACTSCNTETEQDNDNFTCLRCTRNVPYPDIKFKICVVASDGTAPIQIILADREVRTLIGKTAREILQQMEAEDKFPTHLKLLAQKDYTFKIEVRDNNVDNGIKVFWATNCAKGFVVEEPTTMEENDPMEQSNTQQTTSTMHLDDLSDIQNTSNQLKKKGKEVQLG